ncbi:hypothetical protein ACFWPX_36320 [Nocardia sp. NPDC058518]|uniref:hypothetical protein n=1 Tax=Nocardia sp. NPDC058518 TaxID=3346534 RepID=UPI00365DEB20
MRYLDALSLRKNFRRELEAAADERAVVITVWDKPVAVWLSPGMWAIGRERVPVDDSFVGEIGSVEARPKLTELHEAAGRGQHAQITKHRKVRAVMAPYDWGVRAFPELDLAAPPTWPPTPESQEPPCALVLYRKRSTQDELVDLFAEAEDPVLEGDRRLSAGRAGITADRRSRLRAVAYVVDGKVERVRAVTPGEEWIPVPGQDRSRFAPLSAPLSAQEIDELAPGLGLYPGDEHATPGKTWREYVPLNG